MSDTNDAKKDVCETEEKPVPLKTPCPDCKPNPSFVEPNWREPGAEGDVYLNEKTCEYMVAVTKNKEGLAYTGAQFDDETNNIEWKQASFLRKYVQPAIETMLADQGKLITEQIICAFYESPTMQGLSALEMVSTYSDFTLAYNSLQLDPLSDNPESNPCRDLDIIPETPSDLLWNPDALFTPGEPINPMKMFAHIEEMLPEVSNPFALEIYAYPKDYYIGEDNILRVLVAIPAYVFEQVPDNPTADDIEKSAMQTKKSVEFDVIELYAQQKRLELALLSYGTYQAFFHKTRKGKLYWQMGENQVDFYCKSHAGNVKQFYNSLKDLCKKNGWIIRSFTNSVVRNNAAYLMIEFDDSDPERPYVIDKIKVRKKGCPWVQINKGVKEFSGIWSNKYRQTTLNYFAKLKEIDLALTARKSYPWLDFCVKFTYPLLSVSYGSLDPSNVEKTAGSCVANNARDYLVDLKDTIFSETLSFRDAISFEFNQKSCTDFDQEAIDDWDFLEVSENHTSQIGPGREAKIEARDAEYIASGGDDSYLVQENELDRLAQEYRDERSNNDKLFNDLSFLTDIINNGPVNKVIGYAPGTGVPILHPEAMMTVEQRREKYEKDFENKSKEINESEEKLKSLKEEMAKLNGKVLTKKQARKISKTKARKAGRAAKKAANKKRRKAIATAVKESAIEEFNSQDNLQKLILDIETFQLKGSLTKQAIKDKWVELGDIVKRITICNLNELVLGAVDCLYSGIPLGVALERAVRAALEAMDADVLGFFIRGLPLESQEKLRSEFEKTFGNLPLPWEEGYNPGSKAETNGYIAWLSEPPPAPGTEDAQEVRTILTKPGESPLEYDERQRQEIENWIKDNTTYKEGYVLDEFDTSYEYLMKDGKVYITKSPKSQGGTREAPDEILPGDTVNSKAAYYAILDTLTNYVPTAEEYKKQMESATETTNDEALEETGSDWKSRWNNLSDSTKERIIIDGDPKAKSAHPGTYGSALDDMEKLIISAYIDYIMDLLEIDTVLKVLERFPGAEILGKAVFQTSCAYQGMMNPPIATGLKSFTLNTCEELGIGMGMPEINLQANFFKGGKLMIGIEKKLSDLIDKALEKLLMGIITKVLETIDGSISKMCQVIENQATNILFNDSKGLDDAFREAFCPDADPIDLNATKGNLFRSAGLNDNSIQQSPNQQAMSGTQESLEKLFDTLNATMTKQEVTSLIVNSPNNMDTRILNKVASLTNNLVPEFSEVFGNADQVASVFAHCGNYVPPEAKAVLRDQLSDTTPSPVRDSVCLTNAQYEKWNEDRLNLYTRNGLSKATAEKMIKDANQKNVEDLDTLSEFMQKGAEKMMQEAISSIINPRGSSPRAFHGTDDPACIDIPWNSSKQYIEEGDRHDKKKRGLVRSIFENLETTYLRDLLVGKNGVMNNILRDKNNFRLKKHERRVSVPLWQPNYVDSQEQWEFRKENANKLVTVRMDEPHGTFPETVGGLMRDQLSNISNLSYTLTPSPNKPEIEMHFSNASNGELADTEFWFSYGLRYEKDSTAIIKVDYLSNKKMSALQKKWLDDDEIPEEGVRYNIVELEVAPPAPWERYTNFNYDESSPDYPYQSMVFQKLLNNSYALGSVVMNSKLASAFADINSKVLKFASKAVTTTPSGEIPVGFSFGLQESSPLTFADLLYVNPDADPNDPMTWRYTHMPMEKVLGKSATENPRVHFLDPSIHGGSYISPKIYVEPQEHSGWMGMLRVFSPEAQQCELADNGFLSIDEVSKRVDDLDKQIPFDERMSIPADCIVETPYDKIASPSAHAIIEGVVLSTVKVYATELLLKTIPLFGSVQFNDNNIDSVMTRTLIKQIKEGMKAQENRWNIIQGYTYYLTFLEQSVQVAQRQIRDGLLKETPELTLAKDYINSVQKDYPQIVLDPKEIMVGEYDWSVLDPVLRGASIIAHGEDLGPSKFSERQTAPGGQALLILNASKYLTPFKMGLCRKINTIHNTVDTAEVFLSALIFKEMQAMIKKMDFNLRPRPHIYDIQKYLLSGNGILYGSTLRSGETIVEHPTVEGATGFEYGDILNVVTDISEHPLDSLSITIGKQDIVTPSDSTLSEYLLDSYVASDPEQDRFDHLQSRLNSSLQIYTEGLFYIEKYIKETRQDGTSQIYNIQEFQQLVLDNPEIYPPDSLISSVLGNAQTLEGQTYGSTGLRFGVRLVYCPPKGTEFLSLLEIDRPLATEELTDEESIELMKEMLANRKENRTYLLGSPEITINYDEEILSENTSFEEYDGLTYKLDFLKHAIPLAIYEHNLPEMTFGELDLNDINFGQDLKCYIDRLTETKDFQTLFDYCFPIRSYVSLFGIYSYFSFFESIGKDPTNAEEVDQDPLTPSELREAWKEKVFVRTKRKLRRLFNSAYRSDGEAEEEKREKKKFDKGSFLKNIMPKGFLNLDRSTTWWQTSKMVTVKPFDPEGNDCMNVFQKIFAPPKKE